MFTPPPLPLPLQVLSTISAAPWTKVSASMSWSRKWDNTTLERRTSSEGAAVWGRAAILLWLLCNTGSDKLPKWLIVLHPVVVDWGIKLLTKEPHQTQLRLLYVSLFTACMRTNCVAKGLIHSDWLTGIPAELISRPTGGFVLYVHTYVHTCGSLWCNYMYVCMYVCMYVHTLPPNCLAKMSSSPSHPPTFVLLQADHCSVLASTSFRRMAWWTSSSWTYFKL